MEIQDRLVLDLKGMEYPEAHRLIRGTSAMVYGYKVDSVHSFTRAMNGWHSFREVGGKWILHDSKIHTTPDRAFEWAKRVHSTCSAMKVDSAITVHALGGKGMLEAALQAGPKVYTVTLLTSLSDGDLRSMFQGNVINPYSIDVIRIEMIERLAEFAYCLGVRAFVCPGKVLPELISMLGDDAVEFLVPGTRWPESETHDQQQVVSPAEAIIAGRQHTVRLVVGREVTQAPDPVAALKSYSERLERTLEDMRR